MKRDIVRVTATYESAAPDADYEIRVTPAALEYRGAGEKKWVAMRWNEVFAALEAMRSTDRAFKQLFPKRRP